MRIYLFILSLFFSSCFKDPPAEPEPPAPQPAEIDSRVLTDNLTFPWEILWGPDNYIWITERGGKISRINPTNGNVTPVITINEVVSNGEGGLLGMALHQDFNNTPHVFVVYNYNNSGVYTEKVVRYTYDGTTLTASLTILDGIKAAGIHNGSRLVMSKDNKLFISTGDAADQSTPQNLASLNGKILRTNLDGSQPNDNPFMSSIIWSFGHRNAQGLVFVGDSLYSSEHGPESDDEVNIIHKGYNYGWPNVKGFCEGSENEFCSANNVIEPLINWTPTIATCGIDYYNSDYIPQWKNSVLMATLKGSKLVQLGLNEGSNKIDTTAEYFNNKYGRLRDVCVSPEGKVYLCTSNGSNDKIVEVFKK